MTKEERMEKLRKIRSKTPTKNRITRNKEYVDKVIQEVVDNMPPINE